jgi:hypothetical protein
MQISDGQAFGHIYGIALAHALNGHQIRPPKPEQQEKNIKAVHTPAHARHAHPVLHREVGNGNFESVREYLVFVLRVVGLEEGEGVDEGIMAVLIAETEILLYRVEDVAVILLQLSKGIAGVHAFANGDHELSCMGHHFSAVLAPRKVVALGLELDVPSPLLESLQLILDVSVWLHVDEVRLQGVAAEPEEEIEEEGKPDELAQEPRGQS